MPRRSDGFKDFVLDQLTDLQGLTCRAMFGGYGLYHSATFFGIIHRGRLYFKVTSESVRRYTNQSLKPFRPNAKQMLQSFYEVPVGVLEDAEQLTTWAEESANR